MASRLPSARPGSPTSMAEARRLRVRPPRPCAPSRDLKCLAYVKRCVALCSRARRRATTNKEQPRRPGRPGETSDRRGRAPGRVCETRHSKTQRERCGLRLPAARCAGARTF